MFLETFRIRTQITSISVKEGHDMRKGGEGTDKSREIDY